MIEAYFEDYSTITINSDDPVMYTHLYSYFSVYAKGYLFNPKYKNHIWDGKIRFFNKKNHTIPYGLLYKLKEFCSTNEIELKLTGFLPDNTINTTELDAKLVSFSNLKLRDYQVDALKSALIHRNGVLECATGSGKSLILYQMIRILLSENVKKCLLIVPNTTLVEQMRSDFKSYGSDEFLEILYAGKKPTYDKPLLISTWQSLMDKDVEFFRKYDALFIDECHNSKAKVLKSIAELCVNASYRIGTTGTMPKDKSECTMIMGALGPVIYKIDTKTLQDAKILADLKIGALFFKYPLDFIKQNIDRSYPEEVKMCEEYPNRNVKGLGFILGRIKKEYNTLILFHHLEHLKMTKSYIESNFPEFNINVVTGAVRVKDRENIRTSIENSEGCIILATYKTMSTGVNIKKLNCLIMYSNSKSKIEVLQSIGRVLRRTETKEKVVVFDIIDDLSYKNKNGTIHKNKILKQYAERKKYYKDNSFEINEYDVML
jgi:superfamily II DNA or RNA helicase